MVDQIERGDTERPVATRWAQFRSVRGRLRRGQRGQSMVELALTLPLLALILIGTADLGRAFIYYTRLTNAVEAGALQGRFTPAAAQAPTSDCYNSTNVGYIDCRVVLESKGVIEKGDVVVECWDPTMTIKKSSCAVGVAGVNDVLVVKATYQFRPLTAQLAGILGNGYRMGKTIRMVITG